jgi:RNA polymerase sigma-70 factor (ECF subfamily)
MKGDPVSEHDRLTERFEAHRGHLRAVAYRILGSGSEAEDAVQEAWLRLARADVSRVDNLGGWLTTVVSRVCLDMLRSRASRGAELLGHSVRGESDNAEYRGDPEQDAILVDSVGRALLVVLNTLGPAERIAFVLHDMYAVPFDEIAPIIDRSPAAAKKLASRARHKVRSRPSIRGPQLARHRRVVEAFLAASRAGDLDAVIAVLDPDVVRRADRSALALGRETEVRGARAVAEEIVVFGRNARFAALALIDGAVGLVVAPRGRLLLAVTFTIEGEKIAAYELAADPSRLQQLELAVLDE